MLKQGYIAAADCIYCEHLSLVHLRAVVKSGNLDKAVEAVI
jgi:hypothetical protein